MDAVSNFAAAEKGPAGILFVNQWPRPTHCLAGFQPKRGGITGFGGKAEPYDYGRYHTAWREVLEELFGIANLTLAAYVSWMFEPVREFETAGYTTFVLTFEQLEKAACWLRQQGEESPYYEIFPVKVWDCVMGRRRVPTMEVQELAVLPVCRNSNEGILDELLEDINKI
jgi:hypothetical protein